MKISRLRRAPQGVSAAVLLASVVLVGGCSSGDETPVREEPGALAEPMSSPEPTPMGEAPPRVQEGADFDRARQEATLRQQRDDLLIQSYLQIAQRSMDQGELDKAEEAVLQALQVRDSDPRAVDLLVRVRGLKGDPISNSQDLRVYVQNTARQIREKTRAEVRSHYVAATNAFNDRRLDEARIELEQAALRVKFDPYRTDFKDPDYGDLEVEVPRFLQRVSQALDQDKRSRADAELRGIWDEMQAKEDARLRRDAEEVKTLMVEAVKSFQNQDFDNAEFLAEKVLRRNPGFVPAKELLENAKSAKNAQWRQSFYALRTERWRTWLEEVRESQIPYADLLRWSDADKWAKISARSRRPEAIDTALSETDAIRAIKSKLENETVTFDFGETETTLAQAIEHIRSTQAMNIVVDREVMEEKGSEAVRISLTDVRLGTALKSLLAGFSLAYTFSDDVLFVTTKEKALGRPIPSVHEVRDLTMALPNFKAPDLSLRPGATSGEVVKTAIRGEEGDRTAETTLDQLIDLIRQNVEPETWENDGFALTAGSGNLVAVTTPAIHQKLERFLEDLRQFTKLVVHVESRFISITQADLLEIGFDFRGLGGSNPGTVALLDDVTNGPPSNASAGLDNAGPGLPAGSSLSPTSGAFFNDGNSGDIRGRTENIFNRALSSVLSGRGGAALAFTILNDIEVTGLLRAVEQKANSTLVNAPRLTIFNNQRANLTLVNQVSYVKDYDVEVAQTSFIADPLIDVIQDGLTLDVRPTIAYDRKSVTMEVHPSVASLIRPIRTFETTLSGLSTPVVIELPEVTVQEASTTVRVPDGGYLTIGGFRQLSTVDRRSETPILSNIPIISFFFSRKGRSDDIRDLIIVMHVEIVDLSERERDLAN